MIKKKKVIKILLITLILIACVLFGIYFLEIRSEPYKFSSTFIDNNKTILEKLGKLENSRLSFFGYSVRYSGSHGHAEYKILVKGEKNKGKVYLNLEKSVGVWKILKGNLILDNGTKISLSKAD